MRGVPAREQVPDLVLGLLLDPRVDELPRLLRLAGEVEVARLGQELLRALDVLGVDLEVVGHPQRVGHRQLHSLRLVELRRGVIERD
jgi:hypothetical protein